MCRFVAYLGRKILLEDVLVNPVNSLLKQSIHARESGTPTNGDGFGLGWYVPKISSVPGLFTSTFPAWNDRNLLNLTARIESPAFFGHVRAASAGGVTNFNCHPFIHKHWMLMHNGNIHNFITIKRHLRHLLDDDIYHWIKGETDSEHFFALLLQLSKGHDLSKLSQVGDLLIKTIHRVLDLVNEFSKPGPSYFNICLTDGHRIVASRYCSNTHIEPETLHYSLGSRFKKKKDHRYHMVRGVNAKSILVSSERLNDFDGEWMDVPPNYMLLVDHDLSVHVRPID